MVIVYCQHGDEPVTERIAQEINSRYGTKIVLGNPEAKAKGIRFLESDLNRSFRSKGTLEAGRAAELKQELAGADLIIDLHQTTAKQPPCAIITDLRQLPLVAATGIAKVVYMTPEFSSGGSLIENVPNAISLELYDDFKSVNKIIQCLENVIRGRAARRSLQLFYVTEIVKGQFDPGIRNFREQQGAYPIFSGEKAYKGVKYLLTSRLAVRVN